MTGALAVTVAAGMYADCITRQLVEALHHRPDNEGLHLWCRSQHTAMLGHPEDGNAR